MSKDIKEVQVGPVSDVQVVPASELPSEGKDDLLLEAMGYEQHMKRGFNMWSMTAFCLTGLGLLPSLGGTLWYSLGYLGLISMVWGWLVASLLIYAMVFALAELGSAYPTAGGLYYWTYKCAPPRFKLIACWITAWSMVVSTALGGASMFMTQADMLTALVTMFTDWEPTVGQTYLIYLACIVLCGLMMSLPSRVLGFFGTAFAWLGTIAFFIILIALPVSVKDHNSASAIFTAKYNQTGWSNDGLVFLLGFLVPCWCISGYDSTVHLAEETDNASYVVPRAMMISTLAVALLGWIFNIVLAYCATDIDQIMESSLGQPLGAIMVASMGNGALTKTLFTMTVISNFGAVFVITTSGSRIYFAYARDGALPFHKWLSHINVVTKTPVNATLVLCIIIALIGLISLGSTTALNAFFSGSSLAGAVSYLMPVLMRLERIGHPVRSAIHKLEIGRLVVGWVTTSEYLLLCIYESNPEYVPGPFSLGRWSKPIRWIAVVWTIFTLPLFSFPDDPKPNADEFDWSFTFYAGVLVIILPWYYFRARHWFTGPGEAI